MFYEIISHLWSEGVGYGQAYPLWVGMGHARAHPGGHLGQCY